MCSNFDILSTMFRITAHDIFDKTMYDIVRQNYFNDMNGEQT